MPDSTGNADALSHLMGPDALMTAMLEEPQAVHRALQKIQAAYERIMKEVRAITAPVNEGGGCVQWLNTWAPGFHAQMQCDMSVMISPRLFDEFIAPELKAQSRMLDYALYHFDGVEQIRHLDTLLSIPTIRAIQWTQVARTAPLHRLHARTSAHPARGQGPDYPCERGSGGDPDAGAVLQGAVSADPCGQPDGGRRTAQARGAVES